MKMQPCNAKVNKGKGGVGITKWKNATICPEQKNEQASIIYANN